MDFSRHDFLTAENIMMQARVNVGDREGKKLFQGWYEAEIQFFMEEIGFDTLFFERRVDVPIDAAIIASLQWDMPKGTFNVKKVYGYCGPICEVGQMTKFWPKKNYYTEGGRVVADNRQDGSRDPFFPQRDYYTRYSDIMVSNGQSMADQANYYNVENGVVMFSPSIRNFETAHVRMSGIPVIFGDAPLIPSFMRKACVDWVSEAACRAMIAQEEDIRKYTYLQGLYANRLDKEGFRGSWHSAANRVARMSSGEKEGFSQYIARWTYL